MDWILFDRFAAVHPFKRTGETAVRLIGVLIRPLDGLPPAHQIHRL